jgi:serine protease Do
MKPREYGDHDQRRPWNGRFGRLWEAHPLKMAVVAMMVGALTLGAWQVPLEINAAVPGHSDQSKMENPPNFEKGGFADIAQRVTPAVVNITVSREVNAGKSGSPLNQIPDFFGMPGLPEIPGIPKNPGRTPFPEPQGAGSGVIISPDGYVLTNHHVVAQASQIKVTLPDKREFSGDVVGTDPQTDLAVLKIDGNDLPFVPWGDSSTLRVGDYVLAVGNPFGLNSTVTLGIVSALGRGGMGITQYEDFIQTDAAINPGNSGGALVNTNGELVGINTAIFSRSGGYQGVGFAVPTKLAKPVYASLVKSGAVVRGFLGVGIQEVTQDLAQSFYLNGTSGALVTNVVEGSPADQAGIRRGDVIVEYQGHDVQDPRSLQQHVIGTEVDTPVAMMLIRDGERKSVKTVIRENRNPTRVASTPRDVTEGPLAGVAVRDLDEQTAARMGLEGEVIGVVVVHVAPDSKAAKAGLSQGDIISEIDRQPIRSGQDYAVAVNQLKDRQQALVFVQRGNGGFYVTVKV